MRGKNSRSAKQSRKRINNVFKYESSFDENRKIVYKLDGSIEIHYSSKPKISMRKTKLQDHREVFTYNDIHRLVTEYLQSIDIESYDLSDSSELYHFLDIAQMDELAFAVQKLMGIHSKFIEISTGKGTDEENSKSYTMISNVKLQAMTNGSLMGHIQRLDHKFSVANPSKVALVNVIKSDNGVALIFSPFNTLKFPDKKQELQCIYCADLSDDYNVFIDSEEFNDRLLANITICYVGDETFVQELLDIVDLCKIKVIKKINDSQYPIYILHQTSSGLSTREYHVTNDYIIDIEKHYNTGFMEFHNAMIKSIQSLRSGLHILHGEAGTGKTSYIKFLAKLFNGKKNFIFLPSQFVDALTSPDFIELMMENEDSVLIIEDAENALKPRGNDNRPAVSNLLNISDGILGDAIGCHIICTINCELDMIDSALLRSGRLINKYEFNKLSSEKIKVLSGGEITESMTIADFYNRDQQYNSSTFGSRKIVGFGH